MNGKLYNAMDWARIEGLVYSEEDNPHDFLGASVTEDGILVQTFLPTALRVNIRSGDVLYPMEKVDENGFFAAFLPGQKIPAYTIEAEFDNGSAESYMDPYNYEPQIPQKVLKKFAAGICYDIYRYLGAHPMTVDGTEGVYFAVWAPNAMRVSLVGDFNLWDGRRLPMRRLPESGIFELFLPGMKPGSLYKYEIKAKNSLTFLKSDPYAFEAERRPDTASIVCGDSAYVWHDQAWMEMRAGERIHTDPVSVYQLHPATWLEAEDPDSFRNYREIAKELADYVKKMGYTHVELFPVMEHMDDASMGYAVTGYYAPTSRYGTPDDFRYFIDYLHQQKIGVLLDWVPSHFPRDTHALIGFDGTCLYEHSDPRRALFAADGGLCYNYARAEVKNFLIANALYWAKEFHADGLRFDDISRVLYLDYGKRPGEWVSNLYGGNENLDAVEFFKHLNSVFHKEVPGAVLIAEDTSEWPMVTGSVEDDGLGFDFKWNKGFKNALIEYMQLDPIFRGSHHAELIFSMVYNYSENFMLALPWQDMTEAFGSMYAKVPGKKKNKLANLRAAYGYLFLHPGKKLLSMGCDIAQKSGMSPVSGVDWSCLEEEENVQFRNYMAALMKFYRENPALYALDYDPDGFEWINNISANENMLVFLRKSSIEEQMLLVVVNFSALAYADHKIGVPFRGKYKEIFNSDAAAFGGEGNVNPRVKSSKADECDELPNSIRILVPPMGISVFSCSRLEEAEKAPVKTAAKKSTAKKAAEGEKKSAAKKTAVRAAAESAAKTAKSAGNKAKTAARSAAKTAEKAAAKIAETAGKAAASISGTAEKTEE